jgi:hypothetical protein
MLLLDEAVARFGGSPEPEEQQVPDPIMWRRVFAAGNALFAPGAAPEVEESGALSVRRLRAEGWPTASGRGFEDFVPVLPFVGELSVDESEQLFSSDWAAAFYDLLICLPAAEHLPSSEWVMVTRIAGDDWWLLSFDAQPFDSGPSEPVCVGGRRSGGEAVGALLGGEDATAKVARVLGLADDAWRGAATDTQECSRPW